jgi:ABC-type lipoprotein release transport system permease subunit
MNGKTVSAVFRIVDFYTSGNSVYDEANAFVPRSILGDLMHTESAHEVALILRDEEKVDQFLSEIQKEFPSLDMRSWRALAPELGYADQMMGLIMTLFLGIIMAALAFGIVNTMLMAVLERRKELGMLLAIGMNKRKVFRMIMLETSLLTFLGAPVGMVLSVLSQLILSRTGIDLSFLSEGLRSVGLESVIYPSLDIQPLIIMSILVVITGILSALYPARKAIRLNPGETLRTAA